MLQSVGLSDSKLHYYLKVIAELFHNHISDTTKIVTLLGYIKELRVVLDLSIIELRSRVDNEFMNEIFICIMNLLSFRK